MNLLSAVVARLGRSAALNLTFIGMTLVLTVVAWLAIACLQNQLRVLGQDIAQRGPSDARKPRPTPQRVAAIERACR